MEKEEYLVIARSKPEAKNLNEFIVVGRYDTFEKALAVVESKEIIKYFNDLDRDLMII